MYLCVLYLSQNKQPLKGMVFITEIGSVYWAVGTGSLDKSGCISSYAIVTDYSSSFHCGTELCFVYLTYEDFYMCYEM